MSTQIVKGAAYLFIETIFSMLTGYLFWIIMFKISSPSLIGTASALISLTTIFSTIATGGTNIGIQRFLGKHFSENRIEEATDFIGVSFIITSIGITGCLFLFLFLMSSIQGFDIDFVIFIALSMFIIFTSIMTLLRSIIISTLVTKILPITVLISGFLKIVIAYYLISVGWESSGIIIGFISFPFFTTIVLSIEVIRILSKKKRSKILLEKKTFKEIIHASFPTWIPYSIYTIGIHLGPIVVFGTSGATEAGTYAMPFFIATAISSLSYSIFSITYPKLSSMIDGRKTLAWKATKLSLLVSIPFSVAIMIYSNFILDFFGPGYSEGSYPLFILTATLAPIILTNGVNTLVYAYGNYRQVLLIGLASNIPRIALYFILVPLYGDIGAALSYSVGSITGFIASVFFSKNVGFKMDWKDIVLIIAVPTIIIFVIYKIIYFNEILGIMAGLLISYSVLYLLKIIDKDDINLISQVLPSKVIKKMYRMKRKV